MTEEEKAKTIFDKLKDEGGPFRSTKGRFTWEKADIATDWYRKAIRRLGGYTAKDALQELQEKVSPVVFIGKMFLYRYDPKWKMKLPYYDAFPLVIPVEMYDDGFLGLNLHYLSPDERVYLLHKLLSYSTDKRMDERTSLLISYRYLKTLSKLKEAMPCLKRYLNVHIVSNIVRIDAPDWEKAVFLPVEQFRKAGKGTVWGINSHRKKRRK